MLQSTPFVNIIRYRLDIPKGDHVMLEVPREVQVRLVDKEDTCKQARHFLYEIGEDVLLVERNTSKEIFINSRITRAHAITSMKVAFRCSDSSHHLQNLNLHLSLHPLSRWTAQIRQSHSNGIEIFAIILSQSGYRLFMTYLSHVLKVQKVSTEPVFAASFTLVHKSPLPLSKPAPPSDDAVPCFDARVSA